MSDLIMLICREMGTKRFQRTPDDTTPKWKPRGCQAGLAGPTWRRLILRFGVESSRVFWNLLGLFLLWISMIKSDILIHLDCFLDKPYRKYRFIKTRGIC